MIRNYFKVAWRNLRKNSLYSIINIGGLSIGMAVSFILLIYVYNEFSFDKFNKNNDRLFRVMRTQPSNGELQTSSATPIPLAPAIIKDFPEVDKIARTNWSYDILMNYKDKSIKVNTIAADPAFLDMFDVEFIYGDKKSALNDQSSIILTASGAKAIFGDGNPVGQVIKFSNKYPLKVSAVIKDNPANSSFFFKAFIPWETMVSQQQWMKNSGWGNYSFQTYAMLKPAASLAAVNAKLKDIVAHYDPQNKENKVFLYPFAQMHLYGQFKNGVSAGGSIEYVRLFLYLAIGILLIACINFMNLSTARSERRAREVGIRKAIGAQRFALVVQFMGESLLMAFISFLFAVGLVTIFIKIFEQIINIKLNIPYGNAYAWLAALGVTIITGLVAGSYPALFLSSFRPVKVLKGQIIAVKSVVTPRKILVTLQFTFAVALILTSIFIYKQINYIKDRPVGYAKNGLIEMSPDGNMDKQFENFRADLINTGAITDGALTGNSISNNNSSSWGIKWAKQLPGEDKIPIDQLAATYHVISTFGMKLIEGRDFSKASPADSTAIIINQAAVKMMRFKEPLGQQVFYQGANRTVIGVVENFVWGSPYDPVKPAIIGFIPGWTGSIALRLNPAKSATASLGIIQDIYKKYNPEYPFEYKFLDDKFSEKFNTEKRLGNMSISFTFLTIVISCLGLFGLASFSAEQRRKEIGIRKVLGASIHSIWFNLSQEFALLVLISFPIGAVLSWYYVHGWMVKFTYRTSLSLWVFAITMLLSLFICLATVSWQAIKAALTNPVKSLRSE